MHSGCSVCADFCAEHHSFHRLRSGHPTTAIVGGVQQPKAIVEVIAFNGDGTLDVPAATVSLNGLIVRSLHSVGTYTVEDNCSGTITFNGPTYDMFLSKDGDDISMIQTNTGTVFQGLATRTSRTVRELGQD